MRAVVLIPCTDRKRERPLEKLRARSLPSGAATDVAGEWSRRVAAVQQTAPHNDVYCGRAYKEAAWAADLLACELAVISAGLGVVRENQRIPSYSLTVAPGKEDTILTKITSGEASPDAWWSALKGSGQQTQGVGELIRGSAYSLILMALSANYARLIRSELEELSEDDASRIRVFGAGIAEHLPLDLAASVMPYDERLNGPDSPIPGTMSDFGSRALHHFARCLKDGVLSGHDLKEDRQQLRNLMSAWRSPDTPVRARMSDNEVVRFILDHWKETGGLAGASLRHLRASGNACEQSRFRDLFRKAREIREGREANAS